MSEPSDSSGQPQGPPAERMDLPKWNRARTKRKLAGSPEADAFTGGLRRAGRGARSRWPLVAGGVALAFAAIYGGVWFQGRQVGESAKNTRALAEAVAFEARGQVGELGEYAKRNRPPPVPIAQDQETLDSRIIDSLAALDEAGAASPAAVAAHLVRAQRSMRAGDHAAAQTGYQAFLDAAPQDHPLRFIGQEGLALALEGAGDVDGALAALETLAGSKGSFYRDQALFRRARMLEHAGRTDEAIAVYRQYAEEFPLTDSSMARDQVHARLAELDPDALAGVAKPEPAVEMIDAAGPSPTPGADG